MRQKSLLVFLGGAAFLAGGVALCVTAIPEAIQSGGVPISHKDGSPDGWMPLPAALAIFGLMCLFVSSAGIYLVLRGAFQRIVVDSEGIKKFDWLSRATDEVAWCQVRTVKAACGRQESILTLYVAGGSVPVSLCQSHTGLFINCLKNHLSLETLAPILQMSSDETAAGAKFVPTVGTFRYAFPYSAFLRLSLPIVVLGAILLTYRMDPVALGIELALIAAVAGVIFVWRRNRIDVDSCGVTVLRAWGSPVTMPFSEISALVGTAMDYVGDGMAPSRYAVYGSSASIGFDSSLSRYAECVEMIRQRLPDDAIVISR